MVFAPAPEEVPPLLVSVTTLPDAETERLPSKPVVEAALVPPELKLKPLPSEVGNVRIIFPSEGTAVTVVKVMVVVPTALGTSVAGSILVELNAEAPCDSSAA